MCLFLSPSLSLSLSSVLLPFCFSHSLYLSTLSHPYTHLNRVFYSRPGLFLGTSFHPSSHMGLTIIASLGPAGPPWVSHSSQCFFLCLLFSHCLCHPLFKTPSFLAVMYLLLAVSVPLPRLTSQCLLAPIVVSLSDSAHLSPIFSPLSSPNSLSPWEPSPPTETAPGQLCPKSVVSQSSHPR